MSYKLSIVKNKMMKRIINILILLCCIASLSSCGNSTEERSRVLKIYNWADYIDEDVLAEFPDWYKQQTGEDLRIIYQVFDINEIMLTKIERGHEDFDVVCPSEYIIERMLRKDLLLPIDRNFGHTPDYIPNVSPYIRHELNKTSQPERQTEDYAVPYMWGTAGILFNKKFITAEEADTWDILWDSKNRGKILMKDSYRDAYGTAIIYAHARELADSTVTVEQLMNDNSPQAIALAEQRLKEMKPNIAGWEADFGKEMMTKNKAWINFTWSGDAVWAIEEADAVGVELDYTVPCEGSNIWYDGWVIPRYARNVKAASYFINYLCQPSVALRNMDAIGYVSAVATPEIMEAKTDTTLDVHSDLSYFFGPLPGADSLQIDPVQYPDRRVVERCAMIRDFGDRTELVLEMWSRVKGDNLNTGIVLLIFAVFGLLFIWLVYAKIRKYKQKRRHRLRRKRKGDEQHIVYLKPVNVQGTKNLTQGPINRQLFTLAMPIMATSFIQMAYSLTDMAWVGRLGSESMAAVGAVGILTWMSGSIALLNKVGAEVSVGQSIGARSEEDARSFASHNITIALLISVCWGGLLFLSPAPS